MTIFSRIRALIDAKLLKFLLVGVVNTLVGTAIMFGLYNLAGADYWLASAANYVLTSILSFFLNKYFTFRSQGNSWREILRFALTIAVCYGIAYGLAQPLVTWLLTDAAETVQDNVAMLVGMGLFTVLNYIGQRLFTFAPPKE